MNKESQGRLEKVAGIGSIIIVGAVLVYWGFQISGVLEMLELAYG